MLVATDVAARGIDVSDIDLVVQYRPPRDSGEDNILFSVVGISGCCGTAIFVASADSKMFSDATVRTSTTAVDGVPRRIGDVLLPDSCKALPWS